MSQSTTRRPGRPPAGSEDKRERILREAGRRFARYGYTATSLTDVARDSEISKAGLLHHFGSKEALFIAVLERRDAEDIVRFEGDHGTVWDVLDRFVELVETNAAKPGMVSLYTVMTLGALDAEHPAHRWLHRHFTERVEHLARAFERGKAEGAVAPDAPSRELARTVAALSDGIQVQWLCARADADPSAGDPGPTPLHGETALDMALEIRLLVDMIRVRWGTPSAVVTAASRAG